MERYFDGYQFFQFAEVPPVLNTNTCPEYFQRVRDAATGETG
ncbi:1177_t:CDS:2, partial [Ambispora leptoticha]